MGTVAMPVKMWKSWVKVGFLEGTGAMAGAVVCRVDRVVVES
jgi:hypothetical protein